MDLFETLDNDSVFFYERWGDAPIHSIAAALTLKKKEIHFFNDIAYRRAPHTHCPTSDQIKRDLKCSCNPSDANFSAEYSCVSINQDWGLQFQHLADLVLYIHIELT